MPEASTSRCQKDPSCKASGSKDQGCLVFLDLQAQAQKEARMLDHKTRTPEASLPLRLRNTQTHAFPCSPGPGLALISYLGSPQDGDRPLALSLGEISLNDSMQDAALGKRAVAAGPSSPRLATSAGRHTSWIPKWA